jgi:DNA mismatch repair protein MutL
MYIIDQHAAHERLLYEKFKENFHSKTKETQMLMIPILINLKTMNVN